MSRFAGYVEAQKIDDQISDLIGRHYIVKENYLEWLRFTRTIKTSLAIIEQKVMRIDKGEKD